MRSTHWMAAAIATGIALWLLSGQLGRPDRQERLTLAELNRSGSANSEDRPLTRVRARIIHAEPQTAVVPLRGRTENKRTVIVKSETGGRVVERPIEKGQHVAAGDLLCRVSTDDRQAKLDEGREAVGQSRIEYEGSLKLSKQGLVSETTIATTKARLAAAEAQLQHATIELARTHVRAPFAGLIEDTQVEIGDFVQPGTACATILDLDPMLLVGRVAERDVHKLKLGSTASATLIDGTEVKGTLSFIGRQSDAATRTYPVEVEVPNATNALRSGVTAQISIPIDTVMAHRVSPALLALDDEGRVGVRTLDGDNRVVFNPVRIVNDEGGAVWIAGLPEVATLITVGQELVVPSEQVDVVIEAAAELPASTPKAPTDHEVAGGVGARATASKAQGPLSAS